MVMFDSLNRRIPEPYGCDWVRTPNFRRLRNRTVTFDNSYAGSMPGGEPMERPPDTMLFDLQKDPHQERPIQDQKIEQRMIEHLVRLMEENDAPEELYRRLGLDR